MSPRQILGKIGLAFAVVVIVSPAILFFIWMLSLSVSTGFQTTVTGMSEPAPRPAATACDCSATWRRVSSPYSPWLPVRNHTWYSARSGTIERVT